ncbi:MAG: glycoside hydrolase family 5 protein [Oscillospiraceae bacterium]|nr:glycoside hydrolase family 5 protein [Oscillospiraceae bacterium]
MNFKRKIAAIATAAVCSLSALSISLVNLNKDNVYAVGMSGKTAFEITEQMTIGWNLGNSLDCANTGSTYSTAPKLAVTKWGNPEPTQELFDAVKAAGFNTVRIPTTWYEHIQKNSSGDWEISPDWLEYVKMTVDFAYNNDMFVILNVHHEDWVNVSQFTDETKAAAAEKLEDIWTQIAEEFKDYDQRLIFEGMNEPRQTYDPSVEWGAGDTYSWQYINDLNAIFVDVVRGQGSAENSERVLMLPGYVASSNPDTVRQIAIPEGSGNVALSVHAYLPYFFTMATDSYANHEYKADGSSASGWGGNYRDEINTFFNNMNTIQKEKNAPVIIGEFSASDFGNTDSRINWAKDYLGAAENAKIPCVLWDNNAVYTEGAAESGENHGYINRKNNMWYENSAPVIEAMMQTVGVTD